MTIDDLTQYYYLDNEIITKISQKANLHGSGILYEFNAIFRAIITSDASIKDYIKEINHITFACKTEKFTLVFKKEMFLDAKHIKQTKIVFIDLL